MPAWTHPALLLSSPDARAGPATVCLTYDPAHLGDVVARTDAEGHTARYAYDQYGDLARSTNPMSRATTFQYDLSGRVTAKVSPNGNAAGADPAAYTTTLSYDAFGQTTAITDPLGGVTTYQYDPNQNLVRATDPNHHTTTYAYDADNERTTVTRPDGATLATDYDANGHVITTTDALGQPTVYGYDSLNRVITTTDPLGRQTLVGYDLAGNRVSRTDAVGRVTTYGYDALNRPSAIKYSDGATPNVRYSYTATGQRRTLTDGTGTTTYQYDALDRVITTTNGADNSLGYTYDAVGNTTAITYPDASVVTRTYDSLDRLNSVRDWMGHTTRFGYDAADNPLTQTLPTSTSTSVAMSYDAADRLTGITDTMPLTSLVYTYTRDTAGEITTATDPLDGQTHTYTYNKLAGLITDGQGGANTVGWTNDSAKDITQRLDPSGPYTSTLTYDNAHELTGTLTLSGTTTAHNLSFVYNKDGDRTSQNDSVGGAVRSYGYDQADRLITATVGITTSSYSYDGDGVRQSKTVTTTQGTTTTAETWDTAEGLPALLQDGSTRYVMGPDGLPVEQIDGNGNVQYYLRDQLGSTRALLDSVGHTLATYTYDAYGNPTTQMGSATTPFGYTGQYTDAETSLQYLQARYYDPQTQQFVSVDPLVDQTGQPYAYTADDPLNLTDPTGLDSGCNGASGQGFGRLFSAVGDVGCNLGQAKDNVLQTAGALAAPPCDVLAGGCRLPTGQEATTQAGQWTDAAGAAIATTASDAGAALRPGCVPVLQNCRVDTPQARLRTDYGILAGLYGGVNALTFGGEANLGAYVGLDNNALQCMPEYGQGSRLAVAGGVVLGGYGAAGAASGLARGLGRAAGRGARLLGRRQRPRPTRHRLPK